MDGDGPGLLEEMAEGFAPHVMGCRSAKEAVMLAVVGGRRGNATYRHDINLLLVDGVGGVRDGLCAAAAETVPLELRAPVPGVSAGGALCLDGLRGMSAGGQDGVLRLLRERTVSVSQLGVAHMEEVRGPLLAVAHGGMGGWDGARSLVRGTSVGEGLLTGFDLACVLDGDVAQDVGAEPLHGELAECIRAARLLRPGMTDAAKERLREWHAEARQRRSVSVDLRHAETALRLAFAHAKLCMHGDVREGSMRLAIRMVEEMAPTLTHDRPPRVVLGTGAY